MQQAFNSATQSVFSGPAAPASLGSLLEMQNLRLHPDHPDQNLHFNTIPRWLMCILVFEKSRYSKLLVPHFSIHLFPQQDTAELHSSH